MKEEPSRLETSLADILVWLKDTAESGAGFVTEQAPLVCQEIVTFGRVWYTGVCILCLVIAFCVWPLWKQANRMMEKSSKAETHGDSSNLELMGVLYGVASVCCLFGGGIGFMCSLYWCALAWFAPRLYIIDYLKDLF